MSVISILIKPSNPRVDTSDGRVESTFFPTSAESRKMGYSLCREVNLASWHYNIPRSEKRILKVVAGQIACIALDQAVFGATGEGEVVDNRARSIGDFTPTREKFPIPTRLKTVPVRDRQTVPTDTVSRRIKLPASAAREEAYFRSIIRDSRKQAKARGMLHHRL